VADSVDVRITNEAAFRSMLDGITADLREPKEPLDAVGAALLPAARDAAPHASGELASAHAGAYLGAGRWRLTVDTPYAAALHWGWPGHGIRRRPWVVATWLRNQDQYLERMADAQQKQLDKEAAKT